MKKLNSLSIHYMVRGLIFLALIFYLLYLLKTDAILYFIAPRMLIYAKVAVGGLYIMAVFQFYLAITSLNASAMACECERPPARSAGKNIALYSLFVVPLLLGVLLPNTAMSSSFAAKRGVNVTGNAYQQTSSGGSANVREVTFKTDKFNEDFAKLGMELYQQEAIELNDELFLEKLQSLNSYVDNFAGKTISMKGFVYRDPDMGGKQLIVGRLAITCCTADAAPYGVIVEAEQGNGFAEDSWVVVTGTIGKTTYKGKEALMIQATSIEKTDAPRNPYVYPNYDFGKQLPQS